MKKTKNTSAGRGGAFFSGGYGRERKKDSENEREGERRKRLGKERRAGLNFFSAQQEIDGNVVQIGDFH